MEATPAVNEDDRKLFVGGLPQEANDADIKEYFGQYGEIENVNLKMDPQTGRSRGFAFIVFKDSPSLNAASAQEAHVIKVNVLLLTFQAFSTRFCFFPRLVS
jgi:squid-like protein